MIVFASSQHNDVAILRLSSPAQYTKNVRPVCLAPQGANVQKDTVATVVGWGLTSETGPRPPVLQEITFKVWDNAECKNVYGSMAPGGITEHMLCAGKKGQDSCMGDSGGPWLGSKAHPTSKLESSHGASVRNLDILKLDILFFRFGYIRRHTGSEVPQVFWCEHDMPWV